MKSKVAVALVLVAALVIVQVNAQSWKGWSTLFYRQCGADYEILPQFPFRLQLNLDLVHAVLNKGIAFVAARAACACPNYDVPTFDRLFDPFTSVFNIIQNDTIIEETTSCLAAAFPRNMELLNVFKLNLPDSCNYHTWTTLGSCFVALPLPQLDVTIQFAMKACSGEAIPAMSLECSGNGCQTLFLPCGSNSDCQDSQTCDDPIGIGHSADLPTQIFYALRNISIYAPSVQAPGCFQAAANGNRSPSNDLSAAVFHYLETEIGLSKTNNYNPLFCGANKINQNFPQFGPNSWTSYDDTTGPLKCFQNPDTYSKTTRTTWITQFALTSWNGANALSLPSFFQPADVNTYVNANQRRILSFGCDGQLLVSFWSQPLVSIGLLDLPAHVQFLTNLLFNMLECEVTPNFSQDQFNARFGVWGPLLYLLTFDGTANSATYNTPPYDDYRQLIFGTLNSVIANLPSSCTFEAYLNNHVCAVEWTGLKSLLNMDITILFRVGQCSSDANLVTFNVDCVGTDCGPLLDGIVPCATSSDCPSSAQTCVNIPNFIDGQISGLSITTDDWFDYYLGGENIVQGNPCENVNSQSRKSNRENTCSGPSKFWTQVTSAITQVFGGPYAPNVPASNLGSFCVPSSINNLVNGQTWSNWANSLGSVTNNKVTVNFLASGSTTASSTSPLPSPNPTSPNPTNSTNGPQSAAQPMVASHLAITLTIIFVMAAIAFV